MFELELLELLNKYKKIDSNYEKEQIKNSITSLILQNQEKFEKFINTQTLDDETSKMLKSCQESINNIKKEQEQNPDENSDISKVRKAYEKWLIAYNNNFKHANDICKEITTQLVNFYIINREYVLTRILGIEDGPDYEIFKEEIKKAIRLHYIEKIEKYINSGKYEKLNFFQRIRKKRQLKTLIEEFKEYKFDKNFVTEVLE